MAVVTRDSAFAKSAGAGSATSPLSFSSSVGDVSGSVGSNTNRVLIGAFYAYATSGNTVSAPTMTWDNGGTNQSMTGIGSLLTVAGSSSAHIYVQLFGLIAPATGSLALACSWTGTADTIYFGAVSVYNADQTTGWSNAGTDTGTGTTAASTVTTANGDMAIAMHGNDNASTTALHAASSGVGTSDWILEPHSGNAAQADNTSVGATTTIQWDLGSSVAWGNAKVDVLQLGGGGGGNTLWAASLL